jgi:hypothetical protein
MYSMPKKPTKPVPPSGKKPGAVTGGPMPKAPMKDGQKVKAMQQYMAQKKGKSY